jgi:hypothetical protein
MSQTSEREIETESRDCAKPIDRCATDEDRREALKKLGKYAVYTAPAMLALLLPKRCLADSDPCVIDPDSCH